MAMKEVMTHAHKLFRETPGVTFPEALRAAWNAWRKDNLPRLLAKGIVRFAYLKLDGSVREATGTTNLGKMPIGSHPKGDKRDTPNKAYYDLQSEGWRSYYAEKVVAVFAPTKG